MINTTKVKLLTSIAVTGTLLMSGCGGGGNGGDPDPDNVAPTVLCDPINGNSTLGQTVTINCNVQDDDLPSASVTTSWQLQQAPSGAAPVTDEHNQSISYVPTVVGNYSLRISSTDGELSDSKTISFSVVQPFQGTLKILPLGDSITQGDAFFSSYRYPLWQKLIDKKLSDSGFDFDFVGSRNFNNGGSTTSFVYNFPSYRGSSFDRDHEGHWGKRTEEIFNDIPGNLVRYTPDIALIHLGTNDIRQGQTPDSTINEIQLIIDELRQDNPTVAVLLAKPIPTQGFDETIDELGNEVQALAASMNTATSRVIAIDQNTGITLQDLQSDEIHPNQSGEEKIAQKWFNAIEALINGS